MRRAVFIGFGFCCLLSAAQATDITASGDWFRLIGTSDLSTGAGSDLPATLASSTSQTTLDITNTGGAAWTLRVSRSDSHWPSAVNLAVSLTHPGSGPGSVAGGGYQPVTAFEQIFITGSGDRLGLTLQLHLSGLSVSHLPPDSFNTTISYTVE